jgi:tetratricopeptide (TPR) repeat protein
MSDITGNQEGIMQSEEEEAFLMGQMAQSTGDYFALLGRDDEAKGEYLAAIAAYEQVLPNCLDFAEAQHNKEIARKVIVKFLETSLQHEVTVNDFNQVFDIEMEFNEANTSKTLNQVQEQQELKISTLIGKNSQAIAVTLEENGSLSSQLVLESSITREIMVRTVSQALTTPVETLNIVFGVQVIAISYVYKELGKEIKIIKLEQERIKLEGKLQRMLIILKSFGAEIQRLPELPYPDELKQIYKAKLVEKMEQKMKDL